MRAYVVPTHPAKNAVWMGHPAAPSRSLLEEQKQIPYGDDKQKKGNGNGEADSLWLRLESGLLSEHPFVREISFLNFLVISEGIVISVKGTGGNRG
jgi:hypothetical protein